MKKSNVRQMVVLGLLTAIMLVMAWTPLGYLNIGPLAITLNVIPLAVAAITLGPMGGAVTGAVFGLTSFLQCIGVGGISAMGEILFSISPFLAFVQRFVPRVVDGLIIGFVFNRLKNKTGVRTASYVTGFLAAFLNTLFFMGALVLLFGNTEYVQNLVAGRNVIVFICAFVGINAIFEMLACTVISGAVGNALYKSGVVRQNNN
ncbi:MAG: ECF transporter S component [Clostridia bacterium]|nr:ECF transporter S component [Clostridia bacterium]